jgi:damage-control phosphatase, subfamily I
MPIFYIFVFMNYECLICQVKSLLTRLEKFDIPKDERDRIVGEILGDISKIDLSKSYSPEITRNILDHLKKYSVVEDPYYKEKYSINHQMLKRYNEFREKVLSSQNSFDTAMRLAIAGNIIDYGPNQVFDLEGTLNKVIDADFAIDHSEMLRSRIEEANTILYLGDNCGEIVLDKLFLETIGHPNVWFAVRDKPVLNDVTIKEAEDIGINELAHIISNGDDAPSTLLRRVSPAFMKIYNSADLIISKGMGNYEGLMFEDDPRIFFLFMVKCSVISDKIGAPKGEFVVKHNWNGVNRNMKG